MKKEIKITEKSKIILISLVFLLAIVPVMMNANNKRGLKKPVIKNKEYTFKHVEDGIVKEEIVSGVKFSNISLITKNGQTTFTADVTNVTNENITKENFNINLLDKDNKVLITLRANISNGLKKGESKKVYASARGDFKNVVSKVIKE